MDPHGWLRHLVAGVIIYAITYMYTGSKSKAFALVAVVAFSKEVWDHCHYHARLWQMVPDFLFTIALPFIHWGRSKLDKYEN